MKYVNVQKEWRKLGPIYRSASAKCIWLTNMREFVAARQLQLYHEGEEFFYHEIKNPACPHNFDNLDWLDSWHEIRNQRGGRLPAYTNFCCSGACHWLVDLNLYVVKMAWPSLPWRIVVSDKHSTVWDSYNLIFDPTFLALGIPPDECWEAAVLGPNTEFLEIGEQRGFVKKLNLVRRMAKRRGMI